MVAVAASAVVLLSATLLLGYLGRTLRAQGRLEALAQARLSQASAVDFIRFRLASGEIPDGPISLETGGLITEVTPAGRSAVPPLTVDLSRLRSAQCAPAACPGGIVVVESIDDSLVVSLLSLPDLCQSAGFPVEIPAGGGAPVVAGFGSAPGGHACAIAMDDSGGLRVCMVDTDGSVSTFSLPGVTVPVRPIALAGMAGGSPVMLLGGAGSSFTVSLDSGALTPLDPLPGTVPVLLDGRVLCVPRGDGPGASDPGPVMDAMSGDFDLDGHPDAAWACPHSMTVWLSSRDGVLVDSIPGSTLSAWGVLTQVQGLACCWQGADGARNWDRLSWSGFQTASAWGAMLLPWRGRVEPGANLVLGILSDSLSLASCSGSPVVALCPCISVAWDGFDGGPIDAACFADGALRLVLDPGEGGGMGLGYSAVTGDGHEALLSGTYHFAVFTEQGGARKVRLLEERG